MSNYEGLSAGLRTVVSIRDGYRCRWCGRVTNFDLHHIRYRRGPVDDVEGNLISLCRACHGFVHGNKSAGQVSIVKEVAQVILFELVDMPGVTGLALWRQRKRQWANEGRCEHGHTQEEGCFTCEKSPTGWSSRASTRSLPG